LGTCCIHLQGVSSSKPFIFLDCLYPKDGSSKIYIMSFPGRSAPSSTMVREPPVICLGVTFAEYSSYVAKRIMVSRVKSFKLSFLLILNPKGRPVISIDHACKLKPYII